MRYGGNHCIGQTHHAVLDFGQGSGVPNYWWFNRPITLLHVQSQGLHGASVQCNGSTITPSMKVNCQRKMSKLFIISEQLLDFFNNMTIAFLPFAFGLFASEMFSEGKFDQLS